MSKFKIFLILLAIGLLIFALSAPILLMKTLFWTGGILVALWVWISPNSDKRYSSGYKNNETDISIVTLWPGLIFLALGGLLYWLMM